MMTPPLLITPLPGQVPWRFKPLGPRKGPCQPQSSCPQAQLRARLRPRAPSSPFLPSCPVEQPWCSKGLGGHGLAPKGVVVARGSQARRPSSPSPPLLHLVPPLDQTRNKENVWNLSYLLLSSPLWAGTQSLWARCSPAAFPAGEWTPGWARGTPSHPHGSQEAGPGSYTNRERGRSGRGRFYFFKNIEK